MDVFSFGAALYRLFTGETQTNLRQS